MNIYHPPADPADPEAAALELIVMMPIRFAVGDPEPLRQAMQCYCSLLDAAGAFTGMAWHDAKQLAAAISFDVSTRDDPGDFLRQRAQNVQSGADGMTWTDRDRVISCLRIAASVVDTM